MKSDPGFYGRILASISAEMKHSHIQALAALKGRKYEKDSRSGVHIGKLKSLIQENPDDPNLLISLAWLFSDNDDEIKAMSLVYELIAKWPELHRSWLVSSNTLYRYSWTIRGTKYWRDIPDKKKRYFRVLQRLSGIASDNCYSISDGNPACVISKMTIQSGYSSELMDFFHEAIQVEPHNRIPYNIALNFSARKWGGSDKAQQYVLEQAIKNNPDVGWTDEIRERWAPELSLPIPSFVKLLIIILLIIILVVAYFIYRKYSEQ